MFSTILSLLVDPFDRHILHLGSIYDPHHIINPAAIHRPSTRDLRPYREHNQVRHRFRSPARVSTIHFCGLHLLHSGICLRRQAPCRSRSSYLEHLEQAASHHLDANNHNAAIMKLRHHYRLNNFQRFTGAPQDSDWCVLSHHPVE